MAKGFKPPTLLVIADNPSVRFWMKKYLKDLFFVLDTANRDEALQTIKNSFLDFIIIDGSLDTCDPLKLCKEIREITRSNSIPILLITGRLKKSYLDQALDAGVTDFLNNELDIEELEMRIATGKKASSLREKTEDLASILQAPKKEISKSFFKNKFWMHDQALRLLAAAKIEKVNVLLLVLRIDGLAEMQEKEGIRDTDQILSQVSETLAGKIREGDLLIPSSDGQWILLLPNTEIEEGHRLAEHLRKTVQKSRYGEPNHPTHLTLSIVLSSLETSEDSFNHMVDAAIKAFRQSSSTNLIISLDSDKETP